MTYHLEPQVEAIISQSEKCACIMGTIEWPAGMARFHNGAGPIKSDGETYWGVANNGMVSVIKEGSAPRVTLTLITPDTSVLAEALKDDIEAFIEFCNYRTREEGRSGDATITREEWLGAKRRELHSRMRNRRSTRRRGRSGFRSIF